MKAWEDDPDEIIDVLNSQHRGEIAELREEMAEIVNDLDSYQEQWSRELEKNEVLEKRIKELEKSLIPEDSVVIRKSILEDSLKDTLLQCYWAMLRLPSSFFNIVKALDADKQIFDNGISAEVRDKVFKYSEKLLAEYSADCQGCKARERVIKMHLEFKDTLNA